MAATRIALTTHDGVTVRGNQTGRGDDWIILVHGYQADLTVWRAAQRFLQSKNLTRLAINLRGHGTSEGPWNADRAAYDIEAAIGYARHQKARSVFVLAEGQGATAALAAADRRPPDGLILLSPGPLAGREAKQFRGNGVSKLFIVGSRRQTAHDDTQALRRWSIGWAAAVYLPTEDQGSALLSGASRSQTFDRIMGFLNEQRYLGKHDVERGATDGRALSRQERALQERMLKRMLRR
jgi:pimeloyl-ACP methyl ester carboxylesterase